MGKNASALLAKYQKLYEKNPRGKVFAPLAQVYRKLGMLEEALKILKNGLKHHPTYTLGYLVLAECYYDQGKVELVHNTLRPFAKDNLDNISLQKLYALASLELGFSEEALETYKFLLFQNPRDQFFKDQVRTLEDDLYQQAPIRESKVLKEPTNQAKDIFSDDEDQWVQVDFSEKPKEELKSLSQLPDKAEFDFTQTEVVERSLDDDYFSDDPDIEENQEDQSDEQEVLAEASNDVPLISLTLVDLYLKQNHLEKAEELLEEFHKISPHDERIKKKMFELKEMQGEEEENHHHLLNLVETSQSSGHDSERVKKVYESFLYEIKNRAKTYAQNTYY